MQTIIQAHDDAPATSCCWRSDGGIVTGGLDGSICVWRYDPAAEAKARESAADTAAKDKKDASKPPAVLSLVKKLENAHTLGCVSVSANLAGSALVSTGVTGELSFWDLETHANVRTLELTPSDVWKAAYSPILPQVATGGEGGVISVYRADTFAKDASIATGRAEFINNVAYSPDGRFVAACCVDGSVHIADVEASVIVSSIPAAHFLPIRSLSFSHDGAMLFTGSDDRTIHVYDVSNLGGALAAAPAGASSSASVAAAGSSSALICSLVGHLHWVTSVAASPATHHLASGSADRTVRVWDVRKREQVHAFEGHSDRVWGVSWNPTGSRIASTSDSGAMGFFPVSAVM